MHIFVIDVHNDKYAKDRIGIVDFAELKNIHKFKKGKV